MDKNLISIIVPVYNVKEYIRETLDSILEQTYSNFELILVDNNSTDSSLDICKDYEAKDKRIKIIHASKQGCGLARNEGLKVIKGDYVTFIDSDDLIPNNYLEVLLDNSNHKDIAYTEFVILGRDVKSKKGIKVIKHSQILKRYFKEKNLYLVSAWGKLIPKLYVHDLEFFLGYMEDVPVMYKVLLKAEKLIRCNEIKYLYRKRENSLTTNNDIKKYLVVLENAKIIEEDLKKRKVNISTMKYFIKRKIHGYFSFLKQTYGSLDEEIVKANNYISKDVKKNFIKYIFLTPSLKIKIKLTIYFLFPALYFYLSKTKARKLSNFYN